MRRLIFGIAMMLATPLWAEDGPVITVSGLGEVAVAPDMARISIGVTQEAATARAAMDAFNADLAAVMARITAAGVDPADMQTSGLMLRPIFDYSSSNGEERIVGYLARSDVTTHVRDLDMLPQFLDAMVSEGATDLGGLQFDLSDRTAALEAARRAAVADASAKAATFADAAGLTLGAVQEMSESVHARPAPMMSMRTMAEDSGVPIAEGEITVSATITIRYGMN